MDKEKDSFWKRISYKYRLSVMNEDTLMEAWHIRLSKLGVFTLLSLMFALTMGLMAVLIIYTPIRNVLPGYSESLRKQLIIQTTKIDSLSTDAELQRHYLEVIKQVVAGEVSTDSVQSLDSLQMLQRTQLLEAKNEVTEEFLAQYEAKGRDNLQLFDIQQTVPAQTFFRPAHGVISASYMPEKKRFGVEIRTPENENVTSVLSGSIVHVDYEIDNSYTIIVQHTQYLSVYKHVGRALKQMGEHIQAGESIGIADAEKALVFELWQDGRSVNPEDVIVF